jgi:hypothetical protein
MRTACRFLCGVVAIAAISCGGGASLQRADGAAAAGDAGTAGAAAIGGSGSGGAAGASAAGAAGGEAGAAGGAGPPPNDGGPLADAMDAFDASPPIPDEGNLINASNWNETTLHPLSARRMLLRDEAYPKVCLVDLGAGTNNWCHAAEGPWARGLQLIGNNQVMGGTSTGYQVFDLTTGQIVKTVSGFGNTQSAYRMANGETMLTVSGTTLTFLDKIDQVTHRISYPGFGYVRMARPTRKGTFLVPSGTQVFEGDATGKVLWMATGTGWNDVFEALLMKDGSTIVGTAFGASLDVLDETTHAVSKRYGTKMVPDAATILPNYFAEFQILPNGNLITSNWEGHGGGPYLGVQVLEFNPAGDLVWIYKQDPAVFNSIQGVLVLDGLDPRYLHVQETSDDSTWQPVNPTPPSSTRERSIGPRRSSATAIGLMRGGRLSMRGQQR